jgi:hypothetical protein
MLTSFELTGRRIQIGKQPRSNEFREYGLSVVLQCDDA